MNHRHSCRLWLACFASFAATSFGFAQAHYKVQSSGKPIGTASLTQKLLANGEKQVQLTLELNGTNGKAVTVREEARYDLKGAPIRIYLESIATNPPSRTQITATFDAKGATATIDEGGARRVKPVPLIETGPRSDASQFWFIRDIPKKDASVKYYRFDAQALEWTLTTTTYVGPKTITIAGKKFSGFEIRDDRATTIVDEKGLPLRIELSGYTIERVLDRQFSVTLWQKGRKPSSTHL